MARLRLGGPRTAIEPLYPIRRISVFTCRRPTLNIEMLGQLGYRPIALTAARATFALKVAEWFRRGRLLMVSPVHGDYRRCQAEIPLIVLFRFPEPALSAVRMQDRSARRT